MKKFSIILSLSLISFFAFPQWKWQNSSPAGNPLYAVFFTDPAHGYAAGDAGTILKTTDGGATWTFRSGGQDVQCISMFFTNDNNGYIAGRKRSGSVILKTSDTGNSWNTMVSDTASALYSVFFPSNNIGYCAGLGGEILKTTDGGDTWTHHNIAPCDDLMSLYFTNDQTGYAAGYDNIDYTGKLLKTIDGGVNWDTLLYLPNFTSLSSVFFTDANTGYVGGSHALLKTVDAGLTWSVDSVGLGPWYAYDAYGVFFVTQDTGYAPDYMGNLYRTTDAGGSWHFMSAVNDAGAAICFPNASTGYAVTATSCYYSPYASVKMLKTENGGSSWSELSGGTNSGYCLFSVFFPDDSTGYAGGISDTGWVFMKTTNGGNDWSASSLEYPANCQSLFFTGKNVGFMAGYQGYIGKTNDGGTTWTQIPTGTTDELGSVFFTNANTGYAAGAVGTSQSQGIILKTVNSGATWSSTVVPYYLYSVHFPDSLTGYAVGDTGNSSYVNLYPVILKTTDGGNTWNKLSYTDTEGIYLSSVFFTDANTGYIAGEVEYPESPFVLKTADGGETWTTIQLPANSCYPRSVYFATPSKGYVADRCGNIFYSADAGVTWTADSSNTWNDLYCVFFPDSTAGYAVGLMSTILQKNPSKLSSLPGKQSKISMFNLFPNPANTKISISSERLRNQETDISVLTIKGEILLREKFNQQSQIELDVSNLAKGIYLVKIQSKEGIEVKKLVID
jgi:photosystem II stability/assembly factor-like uncharacterized protein